MSEVRRFDTLTRVVKDERRHIDDSVATILARLASHRPIPSVAATSDIAQPFTGMVITNSTDLMLYRYTSGAVWEAFLALGGTTAATRHEARYHSTSSQTLLNVTDTKLQFNTADFTTNDVTASGTNNTDFLINRSGVWRISTALRFNSGGSGERNLFLSTGTNAGTIANRFAGDNDLTTIAVQASVSTDMRITSGTSVFAGAFQSSGASLGTDVAFGKTNHISLTWLRP